MFEGVNLIPLAQQAAATPAPSGFVATVLDLVIKGGWIMVPLGLCSLAAVTIVVERSILTRLARVAPDALASDLRSKRAAPTQALARCEADGSPLAAVLAAAIRACDQSREAQEKGVTEAGQREVQKLRKRMRVLSALPQTATMLGLLGTVLGMIRTFTVVAASGESLGKTERLARGIYEAWTATAAGLIVAIPTLLAFHILMSRIDAAAGALDKAAAEWLDGAEESQVVKVEAVETAPPSRVDGALIGASA